MNELEIFSQGKQYIVGLGTLALLNAGLAQSKNRRGLVWFIISLFIGPVATLILVILHKEPEAENKTTTETSDLTLNITRE